MSRRTYLLPSPPVAFNIREFCAAHRISPATYYELKKKNLTPREMRIGKRRIISCEAAAEWRAHNTSPAEV